MRRQLVGSAVGAGVGLTAGLLVGAVSADPQGPFGPTVAAWVQGLGTVWAIIGAAWIALGQSRESAAVRAQAAQARYLACSRLVTLYRVMVRALIETLAEKPAGRVAGHLGLLTRRRFDLALSNLRKVPIADLGSPDAVVWMVQALDIADLVTAWIEDVGNLCARPHAQVATILKDRLPHLRRMASDLEAADDALRDIAEPGWRERLARA